MAFRSACIPSTIRALLEERDALLAVIEALARTDFGAQWDADAEAVAMRARAALENKA